MPRRIITRVKAQTTFNGLRLKRYNVFSGDAVIAVIQVTNMERCTFDVIHGELVEGEDVIVRDML